MSPPSSGAGQRRRPWLLLAACVGLAAWPALAQQAETQPADAQPAAEPAAPPPETPQNDTLSLLERSRLTGDWGGVRTDLEDVGVTFKFSWQQYAGVVFKGLDTNHAVKTSCSYTHILFFDFDKMNLIPGGSFYILTTGSSGRNINPRVGAISDPIDDADDEFWVWVDQAWYEQSLFDKTVRWRIGYLDEQSIVDRNAVANQEDTYFMNTLLDNNNFIVPMTVGFGTTVFWDPCEFFGMSAGVAGARSELHRMRFKEAFDGEYFGYLETDFRVKIPTDHGPLPGNYRLGVVYDPRTKNIFGSNLGGRAEWDYVRGDVGFYMSLDQMLYREQEADEQGLTWFFRYGHRRGHVNRIADVWSTGVMYRGLIPGRDKDHCGFGMYQILGSHDYQNEVDADFRSETGYELYYNIKVTGWLTLSPGVQYIDQPGAVRGNRNAVIAALRAQITF